ncbi:dopamine beta-hydroxylase-like, partial [Clarias magur]
FHGGEGCSCSQTSVEDEFSSVTWDAFSAEVLDSLYTTSPISMHCNRSTAERFP